MIQELRRIIYRPGRTLDLARLVTYRPLGLGGEDNLQILVRRFSEARKVNRRGCQLTSSDSGSQHATHANSPVLDALLIVPNLGTRTRHHPEQWEV
jgi:hypothetical protein